MASNVGIQEFTLRKPEFGLEYGALTFIMAAEGSFDGGYFTYGGYQEPLVCTFVHGCAMWTGTVYVTPRDLIADRKISITYYAQPPSKQILRRLKVNLSTLMKHEELMLKHLWTRKYFFMKTAFELSTKEYFLDFLQEDPSSDYDSVCSQLSNDSMERGFEVRPFRRQEPGSDRSPSLAQGSTLSEEAKWSAKLLPYSCSERLRNPFRDFVFSG